MLSTSSVFARDRNLCQMLGISENGVVCNANSQIRRFSEIINISNLSKLNHFISLYMRYYKITVGISNFRI